MKTLLFLFSLIITSVAFSQDLRVSIRNDETFNPADSNYYYSKIQFGNYIMDGLPQADGKVIILSSPGFQLDNKVFRINSNGFFDSSFGVGIPGPLNNPYIYGISSGVVQPDGKVVFVGDFGSYNGTTVYGIVRVNSDGTIDNTLHSGFGFDYGPSKIMLQEDGKYLISGVFTTYNGNPVTDGLIRLNSDGSIDASFHYTHHVIAVSPYTNIWKSLSLLPDGKILLASAKTFYNNDSLPSRIIRLNSDGTDDSTFNGIEDWNCLFIYMALDPDGNIVSCWGRNINPYTNELVSYMKRYTSEGILDNTFDTSFNLDINAYPYLNHSIYFTHEKKIVVAASFHPEVFLHPAYVFNYDGKFDSLSTSILSGFNIWGGAEPVVASLIGASDSSFIVLGQFVKYNGTKIWRAAKINEHDFSIDGSYNLYTRGGPNGDVYAVSVLRDNTILIGGGFTHYDETEVNHIVKLDPDGIVDGSFHPLGGFNNNVYALCEDSNKVVVGGDFTMIGRDSVTRICRLYADGSVDTHFNTGAGFNGRVNVIVRQHDGKYLVGGDFTSYDNQAAGRLVRLNADGVIDNAFDIGSGFNGTVKSIYVQPDGKILVGGSFTTLDNLATGSLVRLTINGEADSLSQKFLGTVNAIAYQMADNKFIIGGQNLDGHNTAVFRCLSTGVIDTTLKSPYNSQQPGVIYAIDVQEDGLIVMGGNASFTGVLLDNKNLFVYANQSANPVFNDSVSYYVYDLTTEYYARFPPAVYSISHEPENKVIIGGMFTEFHTQVLENGITTGFGFPRNNINKIILTEYENVLAVGLLSLDAYALDNKLVKLDWSTSSDINSAKFVIQRSADGMSFDSIGVVNAAGTGRSLTDYGFIDKNPLGGINYYKIRQFDKEGKYEDSRTVAVKIAVNSNKEIRVYPTIFSSRVTLQASDPGKVYSVSIIDMKGRNIGNMSGNISTIDAGLNGMIGNLAKGMYILRFTSEGHTAEIYKIIKH